MPAVMHSWFSDTIAPRSLAGEIERRQHRCDADGQPHKESADQQDGHFLGDGGDEGQDDAAAAHAVRQVAGHRGPDRGARKRDRDNNALECRERAMTWRIKSNAPEMTPVS
jgi:hypothetical protein